MDMDKEF